MAKARFLGSEIYRNSSYGKWHPLRVPRVSTVMDLSRALGWLPAEQYTVSPRAKPAVLSSFHTPAYLEALVAAEAEQSVPDAVRRRHNLGTPSNPVFPEMFRRPATSVGAALLAGEMLRDGGVIYAPGCGTHHGMPDRANGFCFLNDPVFAIQSLLRNGCDRVAYVDIDAHHPDGVEFAFAHDPRILMVSVHEENRWPRTGALDDIGLGQVWNLPVPRGFHDDEMALVEHEIILPIVANFQPDAIVLQCGADAVEEDPQSRLSLSNNAHFSIVEHLRHMAPRYLVLGGGGYNPWSVGRLWTGVWGVLNNLEVPDELPMDARDVLASLIWTGRRRTDTPAEHWLNTLKDPPRHGEISDLVRERVRALQVRIASQRSI